MADLSCKYLGLQLKNPVVAGSSGLTSNIENLKTLARLGAGAVVLKSIFEEQIKYEATKYLQSGNGDAASWQNTFNGIVSNKEFYYDEAFNYLTNYAQEHTLNQYLKLIGEARTELGIPVIASINCNTQYDWQNFAKRIESAGADALELNIYLLPSDFEKSGEENERVYFDVINEVMKYISIPVSLKTGYYFSSVSTTLKKLSQTGIRGLTLFNRPYNPDIDIEQLKVTASHIFSNETEYSHTLRWIALLAGRLDCDIAASTGIHNSETIIKQLLAGADVVHMASVFYNKHFDIIPEIIGGIESWMDRHGFGTIEEFRGIMSGKNISNPAAYERVQFLRLFTGIE